MQFCMLGTPKLVGTDCYGHDRRYGHGLTAFTCILLLVDAPFFITPLNPVRVVRASMTLRFHEPHAWAVYMSWLSKESILAPSYT